jgi:hypothetical protein
MAKATNVILIPQTPASAFNKNRPVSDLLWEQVEHLAAVVRRVIDEERRAIRTEGQASDFIKKYTEFLNPPDARKQPAPSSKEAGKGARKKPPPRLSKR